jgi:hypothetical protein
MWTFRMGERVWMIRADITREPAGAQTRLGQGSEACEKDQQGERGP